MATICMCHHTCKQSNNLLKQHINASYSTSRWWKWNIWYGRTNQKKVSMDSLCLNKHKVTHTTHTRTLSKQWKTYCISARTHLTAAEGRMESENLMLASRHSSLTLPLLLPPPPSFFSLCFLPPLPLFLPPPPFLPTLPVLHSFSIPPFHLAEPYCIQIHQTPYKAAQLNMSHIIYPQQAASSPFTAWMICKRRWDRKALSPTQGNKQTSTVNSHVSHKICMHLHSCVYVN